MSNNINFNQEGNQYQLDVYINETKVPNINVKNLTFREWVFDRLIYLETEIMDTGFFYDTYPLYELCPIRIELTRLDKKIVMNFLTILYDTVRLPVDAGSMFGYKIIALLRPELLSDITTKCFKNKTSVECIKEICSDKLLGFETEVESNDRQNWYKINETDFNFINHVMTKAYVSEEDMPLLYLDREDVLKYTTLKTICEKESKFILLNNEMMTLDNGIDPIITKIKDAKQKETKTKIIYYNINIIEKNISYHNNVNYSYGTNFTYFDTKDLKSYYMSYKYSPLSKNSFRNKNNVGLSNSITYGFLSKNTHSNYLVANTQNKYLESLFFNSYKQVIVDSDLDIRIGDKVTLILPSTRERRLQQNGVDDINSGEYIIGGILHNLTSDGMYNMILTLFRNGYDAPTNPNIINELE